MKRVNVIALDYYYPAVSLECTIESENNPKGIIVRIYAYPSESSLPPISPPLFTRSSSLSSTNMTISPR